jgi:myo-inositol catabolism protein IolH
VKLAVDPYMLRKTPLLELPALVAELGYQHIELSPREDFIPFFVHPRADRATIAAFRKELAGAGVEIASVLPLYKWSGPDEDERQAAVRYWRRAIQITVDLGCDVMNSEFNGRPELAATSEAQFWRSLEELLPVFEQEGVRLVLEPHPDDFMEDGRGAVDLIRGIDNELVSFLYCAPHTFHQGGDLADVIRYAGPLLTQLHIADSFDHTGSSGLRYIVNPPGSTATRRLMRSPRRGGPGTPAPSRGCRRATPAPAPPRRRRRPWRSRRTRRRRAWRRTGPSRPRPGRRRGAGGRAPSTPGG